MLQSTFVANKARIDTPLRAIVRATPEESLLEPLSPRSIVLSVLLGSHPPRMSVGRILDFTSLFDLADGAVRTALSRMVAAGDLVNDDGIYQLAGRLIDRQAQQDAGRHRPPNDWDRAWWMVAVLSDRRTMAERRTFRAWATGARLGELRPDLWLRPANIDIPTDHPDVLITRGPVIAGVEQQLVARLWDLENLQTRSEMNRHGLDAAAARLGEPDDRSLADAFTALAAAQQFLRVEPQLPAEFTPHATADDVRARYGDVVEVFQARLAEFFAGRRADRVSTAAP